MKFRGALISCFLSIFCQTVIAAPPSLVEGLRDPLHPGSALIITGTGQWVPYNESFTTQFQVTHTFTPDFEVGILVPFFLYDPHGPSGASVPRVGGGSYNRIMTNFLERVMGDAQSYLNFDLQAGLPYQTDAYYRNSVDATWLLAGTITAHYLFVRRFAIEFSLSDSSAFPALIHNASSNQYKESENDVNWIAQLFYYVNNRLDLRLTYGETPPIATQTGTDNESATFLGKSSVSLRQRTFGAGVDFAVNRYLLMVLDGSYYDQASALNERQTKWSLRGKWVF